VHVVVEGEWQEREGRGNRRSGFAPVVSKGFREPGKRGEVAGMNGTGEKWKKGLPARCLLGGEHPR